MLLGARVETPSEYASYIEDSMSVSRDLMLLFGTHGFGLFDRFIRLSGNVAGSEPVAVLG